MKTGYHPNRWVRILDMVGMVIAPISFIRVTIFPVAIPSYQKAISTGNYNDAIALILGTLLILIGFVFALVKILKLYIYHQETRDDVIVVRLFYSIIILGSLIIYFIFFY